MKQFFVLLFFLTVWLMSGCSKSPEQAAKELDEWKAKNLMTPGSVFMDCPDCPEMMVISPGTYQMGSAEFHQPIQTITINYPFAVSLYEVTEAQWAQCVAATICPTESYDGREINLNEPMTGLGWDDAVSYLHWLSQISGESYRLLSNAEWEYVARAGTTTTYSWGDDVGINHANCDGCGSEWGPGRVAPVGSFQANGFGLYDIHGNAYELVEDCWQDTYHDTPTDGSAHKMKDCRSRVKRGGSFDSKPQFIQSASRQESYQGERDVRVGLRLARNIQ